MNALITVEHPKVLVSSNVPNIVPSTLLLADKISTCVVPYWMRHKVLRIVQDFGTRQGYEIVKAIGVLEYNAATILQGEVRAFPELGAWVPADFLQGLQAGHGDNLSWLERAAIVILEYNAAMATPNNFGEVLLEFLNLKWRALGELLIKEGGNV